MSRLLRCILFILITVPAVFHAGAQNLNDLKEKKEKTRKEIEYTNWLLNKTGENSKASLNRLNLINEQITLRNQLISDYNQQLALIQQSIEENQLAIDMMNNDLQKIKQQYSDLIKQAYRKRGDYNKLIFLLSSETFNQAYKRLLYTRQMARFRQKQSQQIETIRTVLEAKISDLNALQKEKQAVLMQQMEDFSKLKNEKNKQSDYYQQLQKRQRELKAHLRSQQRIEKRLENEIQRIIEEEARKAKEMAPTPEYKLLSADFARNKGSLPWPTQHGIITDRFGEHAHPVMKNIIIQNNGIDITTRPGEKARAIFNGTVSRVFAIPGGNTAVIVRHGEYITVYSNLKEVYVKQGEQVALEHELGLIYVDDSDDDKTILKFQIWRENVKLNPEDWIAR
ncbi:murein hydrolase activator EnvC family protein [Roseimarinus sediminis]|uniref:murein hydrolase activator EnvC family protein n=1 Tax=Roseimarinus sediminis TaxID=1610899 RepID=UPI003D1D4A17